MVLDSLLHNSTLNGRDVQKEGKKFTESLLLSDTEILIPHEIGGNLVLNIKHVSCGVPLVDSSGQSDQFVPVSWMCLTVRFQGLETV